MTLHQFKISQLMQINARAEEEISRLREKVELLEGEAQDLREERDALRAEKEEDWVRLSF
jgi:chromosome segregation ATPase